MLDVHGRHFPESGRYHDELARLIESVGANLQSTDFAYDKNSSLTSVTDGVNPDPAGLRRPEPSDHGQQRLRQRLAESVIGLFKTEVIRRRGPWRGLENVELATLEWVDWFNNRRLLEPIGNIPPAEAEARYDAATRGSKIAACLTRNSLRQNRGGSACRKPFSVTVGTVYERSKIPLNKWLLATHLLCSSKKGISTHQLHRMLGLPYKTAWFMTHRIREGMRELKPGKGGSGLGGKNKVVEVDETYVGGKAKNRAFTPPPKKEAVMGLVEREGKLRMIHVPEVTSKTLRPILVSHIDRRSYLMTDESKVYPAPGEEFAGHGTVNHSAKEYVRATFWHTNTIECAFSLLKRGITGTYHHVSQQHLRRYLGEFDFRFNHKDISDSERADIALKGIAGKRLTYRRIDQAANA